MLAPLFQEHAEHANTVLTQVLTAADPRALTLAALAKLGLREEHVHVLAFGKASVAMTLAAGDFLGPRLRFGICTTQNTPIRPTGFPPPVGLLGVDHPLPTARNTEAAAAIKYVAEDFGKSAQAGSTAVLLVLISGGGSAHLALPAEGLALADLAHTTEQLMRHGCTIQELNCVRKHLEQLKGGCLASLASPGRVVALVLSDVVGDPLDAIASGPCEPDPTTYKDALAVLDKYKLGGELHKARELLLEGRDGLRPETPKPGDPRLASTTTQIIGNNYVGVVAASEALRAVGFEVVEQRHGVTGEARVVGGELADAVVALAHRRTVRDEKLLIRLQRSTAPLAIVWGGETTVTIYGEGVGGRCQELALSAAMALDGRPNVAVIAFGTDGQDGPTDAAGAVVTGATVTDAAVGSIDPVDCLMRNDSHTFFVALEAAGVPVLLRSGPTGTNIADVYIALVY